MAVSSRWRTASFLAGALLTGMIIGPPLAQAASAGLVRLVGGGSSHVAKVSASGRLSVNAGLPVTSAGQVEVAGASAGSLVARFGYATCAQGGIYKIPSGKALIITAVNFYNGQQAPGGIHSIILTAGPSATPCKKNLAAQTTANLTVSENQVFPTGIAVPAGDAVGLFSPDPVGSVEIYGYLVRAAAVPHNILGAMPAAAPGGLVAIKPRH